MAHTRRGKSDNRSSPTEENCDFYNGTFVSTQRNGDNTRND